MTMSMGRPGDWEIAWRRPPARGIILFVVGYALVDLLPIILPSTPVLGGLALSDLADAILIFFLVVLYVELGLRAKIFRSLTLRAVYTAAMLLMVQGHAIHFAGNAVTAASEPGAPGWEIAYFLDESWGHLELHGAFLFLAALFIACGVSVDREGNEPALTRVEKAGLWFAALTYGILLAGDAVEGQTVPLMLPVAVALCLWGMWPDIGRARGRTGEATVSLYRRFFAASFGITAAALLVYYAIMGDFTELTELAVVR